MYNSNPLPKLAKKIGVFEMNFYSKIDSWHFFCAFYCCEKAVNDQYYSTISLHTPLLCFRVDLSKTIFKLSGTLLIQKWKYCMVLFFILCSIQETSEYNLILMELYQYYIELPTSYILYTYNVIVHVLLTSFIFSFPYV